MSSPSGRRGRPAVGRPSKGACRLRLVYALPADFSKMSMEVDARATAIRFEDSTDISSLSAPTAALERRPNREPLFWALNAGGWAALCIAEIYFARAVHITSLKDIAWSALFYGSGAILSAGLRQVYRRAHYRTRSIRSLVLIAFPAALVASVIWRLVERATIAWFYPVPFARDGGWGDAFTLANFKSNLFYMAWPFMVWSLLYFVVNFWLEWRRERERALEASLLAEKARLQMLRYQLNPHFLFNALNSIRALVDENKESARAMITELAEFLRYSLAHRDLAKVPLASEMEALGHFLSIQSRRYEEKLVVSTGISDAAGQRLVPCFLIHPLVENAVKYGMQTSPMPLRIDITARVENGALLLTVKNTGKWVAPHAAHAVAGAGTGTGLDNVRQQLETAFPGHHRFGVRESDGWVTVDIEISDVPGAAESR